MDPPPAATIKSKEFSSLGDIVQCARKYLNFENEKKELDKLINEQNADKEIIELAQKELKELIETQQKSEKNLKLYLLPRDEADKKNVILEISNKRVGATAVIENNSLIGIITDGDLRRCLNRKKETLKIKISKFILL